LNGADEMPWLKELALLLLRLATFDGQHVLFGGSSDPSIPQSSSLLHEKASDKQARGRVLVIAGRAEVPGAALLAGLGTLRAGGDLADCNLSIGGNASGAGE
jgi:hypothetical protein